MDQISLKLSVSTLPDWYVPCYHGILGITINLNAYHCFHRYHVSTDQIIGHGGGSLMRMNSNLHTLMRIAYPEYAWDARLFNDKSSWGKAQVLLRKLLGEML